MTLHTDAPAFFLWLSVKNDPHALFQDNAFTLLPGETTLEVTTGTDYTPAKLARELGVFHLRQTY